MFVFRSLEGLSILAAQWSMFVSSYVGESSLPAAWWSFLFSKK
jgi:hypothetical protein